MGTSQKGRALGLQVIISWLALILRVVYANRILLQSKNSPLHLQKKKKKKKLTLTFQNILTVGRKPMETQARLHKDGVGVRIKENYALVKRVMSSDATYWR